MKLTKDQFKYALGVLKDYAIWNYFDKESTKFFSEHKTTFENHTWSLSLTDYGLVKMTLENGVECLYDCRIVSTKPFKDSLDNAQAEAKIMNVSDLSKDDAEYFGKAAIFVMSFFQRVVAFTFFSRMANETIDKIAADLATVK